MEVLIAKGADVNTKNHIGWSPLHMWAMTHWGPSAESHKKHLQVADILVSHGADVSAKDNKGRAPLLAAVPGHFRPPGGMGTNFETGSKEAVEYLIAHGADVNAKDKDGKTPLALAIEGKSDELISGECEETAEMLRKAGAK
jgi:ankyrin repeat protein